MEIITNALELKIYNYLKIGEHIYKITDLSCDLNVCRPSLYKYFKILEHKGLIKKKIKGVSGGSTNDMRVITVIEKLQYEKK